MMKKCIFLFAALHLSFLGLSQDNNKEVCDLLTEMVASKKVAGVVAGYSVDGKILGQAALGYSNMETGAKIQMETKMRMGSIAKSMTAIAIMQLVEKGTIGLDMPVQTYIPDYPKHASTQITIRHLLSHTSGIGGYKDSDESNTKVEYTNLYVALTIFRDRELLFEPGTQYSYTTYGYTLLGAVIEKVTGESFEKYMQKNIWDKAGMTNTGVEKYRTTVENESELYHSRKGRRKAKLAIENNLSNRIPAGGFYTTVTDMLKFGSAVINNVFVSDSTSILMRQHHSLEKENNGYGFGWFLYAPKPDEGWIIGHTGAQIGNSSFLFVVPSRKTVSVIMANTSRVGSYVDPAAVELLHLGLSHTKDEAERAKKNKE